MIENFTAKAMTGLVIIGSPPVPEVLVNIITGVNDHEIKCGLYYSLMKKPAESVEDLEDSEVLRVLNRLKDLNRKLVQDIFEQAAAEDRTKLMQKLKDTNKPLEMGTISEIAVKYGISKSEVRRRKADGTLHELKVQE